MPTRRGEDPVIPDVGEQMLERRPLTRRDSTVRLFRALAKLPNRVAVHRPTDRLRARLTLRGRRTGDRPPVLEDGPERRAGRALDPVVLQDAAPLRRRSDLKLLPDRRRLGGR